MKKSIIILLLLPALLLAGCSGGSGMTDLTKMNSQMIYAQVNDMVTNPEDYIGQEFRMSGLFDYTSFEATGKDYYYCVIPDAQACCSQGIEFIWEGGHTTDEYPARQTEIIIEGVYSTYTELGITYNYLSVQNIEIK